MNWAPISAGANSFIMFDALSLLNARKNSGLLFVPARWNYQEYRFAHDFLGCTAVDSLCTAVPRGDDPVEADADDRIIAEFHNGSEARCRSAAWPTLTCLTSKTGSKK